MRSFTRAVACVALLGAGPAFLAGCGAKTVPIDAAAVVAAAPQKTAAATSAKVVMDGTVMVKPGATVRAVHIAMTGAIDLRSSNGTFEIDGSALGVPGISGNITARFVGGVMYMNIDALAQMGGAQDLQSIFGKKHWFKIDLSKLSQADKAIGSKPGSFTQGLQYLRGVGKNGVKTLGTETVRGTETTHYQADVDVARLRKRLAEADLAPDVKRAAAKHFDQFSTQSFRLDVWIDAEGRMRREHFDIPMRVGGTDSSVKMTLDMFSFGVKVQATAPPADQVLDMNDLQTMVQTHPSA